ncbi:TcpQ domain-containing protein [Yersinia ruckeri]|nr:TcpQ domain-containing protein [Yersinia ruckeri]
MNNKNLTVAIIATLGISCVSFNVNADFNVVEDFSNDYSRGYNPQIQTSSSAQYQPLPRSIRIDDGQSTGYRSAVSSHSSMLRNNPQKPENIAVPQYPATQTKSTPPKVLYSESSARPQSPVNTLQNSGSPTYLKNIIYVGHARQSDIYVETKAGQQQTLKTAIKTLIPKSFSVEFSLDLERATPQLNVNWNSGDLWTVTVDKILGDNNLVALINWDSNRISVAYRNANTKLISTPVFGQDNSKNQLMVKNVLPENNKLLTTDTKQTMSYPTKTPAPLVAKTPLVKQPAIIIPPPVTLKNWTSRSGITLKVMIQEWTEKQGWKLVWRADKDYDILVPFTVYSKSDNDAGYMEAMQKAFSLYEKAQYPFRVELYPDQRLLFVTLKSDNKN